MISFFPDLNVWLALSVGSHSHSTDAWMWMGLLPPDAGLIFSRYTQIGLLRLLSNASIMGDQTLTLRKALAVYDRWLEDPLVEFYPERRNIDAVFRRITEPLAGRHASKAIGDCWLLAFCNEARATLVTFDRALHDFARKQGSSVVIPG